MGRTEERRIGQRAGQRAGQRIGHRAGQRTGQWTGQRTGQVFKPSAVSGHMIVLGSGEG